MEVLGIGIMGFRDLGEHVAHAKDGIWILDVEFFPAVAGPADAGILDWVGAGGWECKNVLRCGSGLLFSTRAGWRDERDQGAAVPAVYGEV